MILLIDNYDSFTYNLYQYIGEFDKNIIVVRNDKITSEEVIKMNPDKIVISPGPKEPKDAGNCLEIIKELKDKFTILGVCLGHQCIGKAFGGKIVHAKKLYHGKSSVINIIKRNKLLKNLDKKIEVGRYHSLVIEKDSIPDCFEINAITDDNEIMAIKHKDYDIYGLQFHPESILTNNGKKIIENFINL